MMVFAERNAIIKPIVPKFRKRLDVCAIYNILIILTNHFQLTENAALFIKRDNHSSKCRISDKYFFFILITLLSYKPLLFVQRAYAARFQIHPLHRVSEAESLDEETVVKKRKVMSPPLYQIPQKVDRN